LHSFPLLFELAVRLVANLLRLSLATLGGSCKELLLGLFLLLDEVVEFGLLVFVLLLHGLDVGLVVGDGFLLGLALLLDLRLQFLLFRFGCSPFIIYFFL